MEEKLGRFVNLAIDFAPKVLTAILMLIIGFYIIGKLVDFVGKKLASSNFDESLAPFLTSMLSVILKVLLLFSVAEMVGIKTTSFVAILAAAGFAIGMALQGSLGNFASGVLILLFRPFKVGDLIEITGDKGWVQAIQIFNTHIKTVTNQNVIIPNSKITSETVTNHSTNGNIRADMFFAIPYEEQFDKVESAILEEVKSINGILSDPAPSVGIEEFDSHNIKVGLFVHSKPEDYWQVFYDCQLAIKKALGKNNIKMAYSEGIELGPIGQS
jgi:small conductance mechanosensitive channel